MAVNRDTRAKAEEENLEADEELNRPEPNFPKRVAWLVVLVVVGVLAFRHAQQAALSPDMAPTPNVPGQPSTPRDMLLHFAGVFVIWAALPTVVYYYAMRLLMGPPRLRRAQLWSYAFLYLCMLGGAYVATRPGHGSKATIVSPEEFERQRQALLQSGDAPAAPVASNITPGQGGDETARQLRVVAERYDQLLTSYEGEMEATDWGRILDQQRLANDLDLSQTNAIAAKGAEVLARYQKRSYELVGELIAELDRSGTLTPEQKKELHAVYDPAVRSANAMMGGYMNKSHLIVIEVNAMVVLLNQHRGQWQVVGSKIEFADAGVAGFFNDRVARGRQLAAEEVERRSALVAELKRLAGQ